MIEQLNAVAHLWWAWMSAMFWQVGLLIVLIACIDRPLRRWAWPQLRYALWSLVLIKLILPPMMSLPSGIVPALRPVASRAWHAMQPENPEGIANSTPHANARSAIVTPQVTPGGDPEREGFVELAALPSQSHPQASPETADLANPQSEIFNLQLSWPFYAMAIWLAGTLTLGIWLLLRLYALVGRRANQAAAASLPQSFYNLMAGCAKRLGLRRVPRVVVVERLTTPAVFGVFRPVLLLPQGYLDNLSRRNTEHVLLHELAHIKRGDLHMHGLYLLLQIVYWYNPLLWLVRRQLHHLRELSCDATVAGLLREQTGAYRQTLLETARRFLACSAEPGLGLLGLFEDANRLIVRLSWLEKPTWRYKTMKRVTVTTIVALMFACVLPMAQARPKETGEDIQTPATLPMPEHVAHLQQQMQQLQQQRQQLQQQLQSMMELLEQRRVQFVADPGSRDLFQIYTVRPGDTLAGLGDRFTDSPGTTEEETITQIIKANGLANATGLQVGQVLLIPRSAEVTERIVTELAASEQRVRDISQLLVKAKDELDDSGIVVVEMSPMPRMRAIPGAAAGPRPAAARVPMDERLRYGSRRSRRGMSGMSRVPGDPAATVEPMSTGLAGYWKLDAAQGAVAVDNSGYGRHGLLHGDPEWRPDAGWLGGALYFDGVDDYIDTGWAEHLPVWTVALWVKSPVEPNSSPTNGPLNHDANYQINWDHGDDNYRGTTAVRVRGKWYSAKFGELKADTWYHLAATYDGESLKAYKDGTLATENALPSGPADCETETLKLGRHAAVPTFFEGTIDEVRVFADVLGPEEIKGLYSQ